MAWWVNHNINDDFDDNICELTGVNEGLVVWDTVAWVRVYPLAGFLAETP